MYQVTASRLSTERIMFLLGARLWKVGRRVDVLRYRRAVFKHGLSALRLNLRCKAMIFVHRVKTRTPYWLQYMKDAAYDFMIGMFYFVAGMAMVGLVFGVLYYIQVIA